jgi:hypothetical protein
MPQCNKCGKNFRDSYNLNTHLSRIKPCKPNNINVNNVILNDNKQLETPDKHLETPLQHLETPDKQINNCEYCFSTFFNKQCLMRHYNCCKSQEDPVRLLEIELEIKPSLPECKTECRFCHKVLSIPATLTKHTMVCQSRKEYHQQLLQQKNKKDDVQQLKQEIEQLKQEIKNPVNTTYNNCNILNVTVDYTHPPKNEHIQKKTLQGILNQVYKKNKNNAHFAGGSGVAMYVKEIRKNPENRNIKLYEKSAIAKVFLENCWVEMLKSDVIKENFLRMCEAMSEQISDYEISKPEAVIEIIHGLSNKEIELDNLSPQDKCKLKQLFYIALRSFEN